MESQKSVRTKSENASHAASRRKLALRLSLAAAFGLFALIAVTAVSAPASAGWAQSNCPLRIVEVDDDFPVSSLINCQFKTILEVELLPLTSGDFVKVYNGTYLANWTISANGITVQGESQKGVKVYSVAPLSTPFSVTGQDINLTSMSLTGSSDGLDASGASQRFTITNLTLQGNSTWGCACHGAYTVVRNVQIVNTQHGFFNSAGTNLDIDGLVVNATGASQYKLVNGGANARIVNISLYGVYSSRGGLYIYNVASNVTVINAFIENATNGIWYSIADTRTTFRNVHVRNAANAFNLELTGSVSFDGFEIWDSGYGVVGAASSNNLVYLTGGDLHNNTNSISWTIGGALVINNTTIRDSAGSGISYSVPTRLEMNNVSMDNITGGYALDIFTDVRWINGSVNNSGAGVFVDWAGTGITLRGVKFTNINGDGVDIAPSITGARVENCTFDALYYGVQVYNYVTSGVFNNNTFNNTKYTGLSLYGETQTVHANLFTNSSYPFRISLSDTDSPQNWNNVTTDNMINGRPIYYLLNVTNVVVPANASLLFIINSTNITSRNLNESVYNDRGVYILISANVLIADARVMGSAGVYMAGSVNVTLVNITFLSESTGSGLYIYNTKDVLVSGMVEYQPYQNGQGVYMFQARNVTIQDFIVDNSGTDVYGYSSDFITLNRAVFTGAAWQLAVFDTCTNVAVDSMLGFNGSFLFQYSSLASVSNSYIINSSGTGLQGYSATNVNVTNVTVLNALSGSLYLEGSNNWTVRNSTFAAENTFGAYISTSPDFKSFNSTYVSINSSSLHLDVGSFALYAVHNNFYGGPIWNGYGYGTWDAGYPAAGNFYSWGAPGFLDKFTGPGQNSVLGMDGIKDAPPYLIGGGKNDNYALMDPWPPAVILSSPPDGSLIKAGKLLDFSISSFFDSVTWADNVTGNGSLVYPHDINTTGWADGWHTITIRATDSTILNQSLAVPNVTRSFSFEFDSTGPIFQASPGLGTPAIMAGAVIQVNITEAHPFFGRYTVDGTPYNNSTLQWRLDTGPAGLNLAAGAHTVVLFANDTLNNSATYNWSFYIDARAPLISRTGPVSPYFQPGTLITFDASDDFNLTTLTYFAISQGAQPAQSGVLVTNGPGFAVDTTGFPDGCYLLTASAMDEAGHTTNSAGFTFCTDSANPVLSDYLSGFSVDEDALYTFDGSLVQDLDSAPAYEWSFDDSIVLSLTTLTGSAPTWTFDTPGMYNVHLKVTDRANNFAEVDFTLTVNDISNPTAHFSLNATYPEDLPITFDGSASTDNDAYWDNGNTGTFSWDIIGLNFSDSVGGMVVDYTILEPGFYNITLYVWDATLVNVGNLTREIRIVDTTPPTIVVAGGRGPFNETDTVTLDASASTDNDLGSPLVFSWRFTYNSNPIVLAGASFNYTFVTPGTYAVTLHVTDRTGVENTTQIFLRINDVPSVTANPITAIDAGTPYEWQAHVVDTDTADSWTYTLLSGPAGMGISPAGVLAWQTSATSYGVYGVSFRVSDGIAWVDFGFVLTVRRPADPNNHAPFFTSFPVQTALPSTSYAYTVVYGDPDATDHLSLVLSSGPAGMALDNDHVLRWIIPADGSGVTYTVSLLLSDGLANVYQNFTIRARPNDVAPVFTAGKVPTTASVGEGKNYTLVIDSSFATDQDDTDFGLLLFFASAADGSTVGVTLEKTSATQWTLTLTGVKPGTTQVTLRVADPSGLSATAPIAVTVGPGQTVTPSGSFPLMYLLLAAALGGAGLVAIVVMRRRKKDEEAPVVGGAAPPAPPAGQVVVPAAPLAAKAEVVNVDVVEVPLAAVGAGAAAAAGAVAFAAVPSPKPKAATYVIEGLFVIYQDGRMIYSKTDIGRESLGDPELVSSMFTAVQQFIKDSFSAEGELNKMGYGENQIVIERGKSVFMATINFGEPDKELQETMLAACEKMEYAYAGIIEKWDGNAGSFQNIDKIVAPILALTAGITRQDVLAATTTRDVKVLSQLEFFQGFVRLKVGIKNDTEAVITKVTLDIDFNEDVLRLQRIEPASYKTSGARVMLNVLNPGEKSSVAFYFDPQICTETNIDGIVRFRDYKGVLSSVTMKTRKAEVVCPLFFTKEHANTAMLKRLIENELQEKDSKIYTITKLPPYVKYKDIFDVAKSVVLSHDVHMVREFVSYNPFSGEAWFYGETKVKNYKIVIRAAVREDNTIEFFAASTVIKAVTGLLAEFNHTLVAMIVERYSDVKIEQVYDEATKHAIQSKALVDKLGESEAGAGETEQSR